MSGSRTVPALFLSYTAIIIGAMIWSGSITERSIYDKYIVRFEGQVLPTYDLERTKSFYSEILDFPLIQASGNQTPSVLLPEKKHIFFRLLGKNEPLQRAEVVLRVRNGFEKLYLILQGRIHKTSPEVLQQAKISEKSESPSGWEFTVTDPDGNHLVFFQPRRQSLTRD